MVMKQQGLSVTEVTCNSLISACERGGRWQAALFLCKGLDDFGLRVDSATYNAAILACGSSQMWLCILDLLQALKAGRVTIDSIAYVAAVDACENRYSHQSAVGLLDEMSQAVLAEVSPFGCKLAGGSDQKERCLLSLSLGVWPTDDNVYETLCS